MPLFFLALFAIFGCSYGAPVLSGSFYAAHDTHTSAGVFAASADGSRSTLVRTLWSRRATSAGSHDFSWDGLTDDGERIAISNSADLSVRVLAADVTYTWEGVIGNFVAQTGPRVPKGYSTVQAMGIAGDVAVLCEGYGERVRTMYIFNASAPRAADSFRSLGHMDYHSIYSACATDGAMAVFF